MNLGALGSPVPRPAVVPAAERASTRAAEATAEVRDVRAAPKATERAAPTLSDRAAAAAAERAPASERAPATERLSATERPVATERPLATERPVATERPLASERLGAAERPVTTERPSASERPVAKPVTIPAPPPPAREKRETPSREITIREVKEVKDWGLAPAQPRGSVAGKIAGCLAVAAIAAGGYFGYLKFAPSTAVLPGAGDQPASESLAGTEPTPPKSESGERPEDPFGDSLDESFDDLTSEPQVRPAKGAPRLAHHTPDAIPIQAVGESKKKQADRLNETSLASDQGDDDEALLDLPLDLDEPAADGTEAATETETANDSEPPLLRAPGARRDDMAMPSRSRAPEKKAGRAAAATDAEALGGFDFAEEPAASGQEPETKLSGISPVDAQESKTDFEESDPLEGFELEETNRRQASSRTVVMRSPAGAPSTAAENDGWIVDDSPPSANRHSGRLAQNPSSSSQRITPRHPVAPAHTPSARSGSELHPARDARPHTESYTVVPNDNFWAISRKQYGSGRYFAALAKHNHARIPDPQKLRAGMQVSTPPASVLEELYPELIDKSGAGSGATTPVTPESVGGRPSFEKPTTARKPALGESAGVTAPAGYFYSKSGAPMYRIGADDTLSSIAQRHLGKASRWTEIYEQNPEVLKNPENLTLGTVIRLPPDAAQIGLAPEVERRR